MSRMSNRPGFGAHRGSLNSPITINDTAPNNPKHKDLWLDISSSPAILKWYDSDTATWK